MAAFEWNVGLSGTNKIRKSGSLKSMHMILKNYPDCPLGIVFSTRLFEKLEEQKLIFLPLYYAGSIIR